VVDGYILSEKPGRTAESTEKEKLSLSEVQEELKVIDSVFFERLNNSEKNNKRRLIRYLDILKANEKIHEIKPRIKKPPYEFMVIGLEVGMETLRKRIKQRILDRLENDAMIKEVANLHKKGLSWKRLESFGLEYKFVAEFLQKKLTRDEMISKLAIATGQFAKRQMTWFRRWEKQGRRIEWVKNTKQFDKEVISFLSR